MKKLINRASFKTGDIFMDYNNRLLNNSPKMHQILAGNAKYSSFTGGGLIISDTHCMYVEDEGVGRLTIGPISAKFSNSGEYRIFRPKESCLAEEIVDLALELYWNSNIQLSGPTMSQQQIGLGEFLCQSPARMRTKNNALQPKALTDFQAEYDAMLAQSTEIEQCIQALYEEFEKNPEAGIMNKKEFVDEKLKQHLGRLTSTRPNTEKFSSAKFITWVTQAAAGALHKNNPTIFTNAKADVLSIRDSETTPALLTEVLKRNEHLIEFKSEESPQNPVHRPSRIVDIAATPMEVNKANVEKTAVREAAIKAAKLAEEEATKSEEIVRKVRVEREEVISKYVEAHRLAAQTMEQVRNPRSNIMQIGNDTKFIIKKINTNKMPLFEKMKHHLGFETKRSKMHSEMWANAQPELDKAIINSVKGYNDLSFAISECNDCLREVINVAVKARTTAIITKNEEQEVNRRYPHISRKKLFYEALGQRKEAKIGEQMLADLKRARNDDYPRAPFHFDTAYEASSAAREREEVRETARKAADKKKAEPPQQYHKYLGSFR